MQIFNDDVKEIIKESGEILTLSELKEFCNWSKSYKDHPLYLDIVYEYFKN
jgi:hypothetical protein